MGQAKDRGSFEVRKAESIERREEERTAMMKRIEERRSKMTPREKQKQVNAQKVICTVAGMVAAMDSRF